MAQTDGQTDRLIERYNLEDHPPYWVESIQNVWAIVDRPPSGETDRIPDGPEVWIGGGIIEKADSRCFVRTN